MIKQLVGIISILTIMSCSSREKDTVIWNGNEVLKKSITFHDPMSKWGQSIFSIHIQEPRIQNPARYSVVSLDNTNGAFELIRNRENHLSKHVIDVNGNAKVYLDDREEIAEELIEAFRLKPERNKMYSDFYGMMYGLPMTLNDNSIHQIGVVENQNYNGKDCFKIPIELKEEMFSKHWNIFISTENNEFKGMEIIFPDDDTKGERLFFDGVIEINEMRLPRIRHWHELGNNNYAGSDIILKEL